MSFVRVSTLLLRQGFQQRLADTIEKNMMEGYGLTHAIPIPTTIKKTDEIDEDYLVPGSGALILIFFNTEYDSDVNDLLDNESDKDNSPDIESGDDNPKDLDTPDVMDTSSIPSDVESTG